MYTILSAAYCHWNQQKTTGMFHILSLCWNKSPLQTGKNNWRYQRYHNNCFPAVEGSAVVFNTDNRFCIESVPGCLLQKLPDNFFTQVFIPCKDPQISSWRISNEDVPVIPVEINNPVISAERPEKLHFQFARWIFVRYKCNPSCAADFWRVTYSMATVKYCYPAVIPKRIGGSNAFQALFKPVGLPCNFIPCSWVPVQIHFLNNRKRILCMCFWK